MLCLKNKADKWVWQVTNLSSNLFVFSNSNIISCFFLIRFTFVIIQSVEWERWQFFSLSGGLWLSSFSAYPFSRNQLSTLPVHLCDLPLKVLIASNNKLVSLPEEIGHLRYLTELVSEYFIFWLFYVYMYVY